VAHEILIIDDEEDIRELVSGILVDEGYETRLARNSEEALAEIKHRCPALIILDIWLDGSALDGLGLIEVILQEYPNLPVVMISGHGNIETAVSAIKRGAYDFIEKPFEADRLLVVVQRAIDAARLRRDYMDLKQRTGDDVKLIGKSPVMVALRLAIDKVAPTSSRVLITGPPGCGKEVAARVIHAQSKRAQGPFVAVNAASMAPERMEVELFGVEEVGASHKIGTFERAHGGTLFLDEVADMPKETQAKILRVLTDQEFTRVNGVKRIEVDVRVVTGSSRHLKSEIGSGRLREDLYHRLNVVPIRVPALKERREDIPDLIEYFMCQIAVITGMSTRRISEDAMASLQASEWPGNVRELRNAVERLLIMVPGDEESIIGCDMLPTDLGAPTFAAFRPNGDDAIMAMPLRQAREQFEREYLLAQIARFGGNISRTASFVGMERSALHRKLKSLGVTNADKQVVINT